MERGFGYSFRLSTGSSIPAIGLGTASLTSSQDEIRDAVLCAIQIGYRHIDTASAYGSESGIGEALVQAFSSGLVRREEMFITSKLWCDDHDAEDVMPALVRSLRCLHLEYLDLYLVHFPVKLTKGTRLPTKADEFLDLDMPSTWKAMEDCMKKGLTRAIGVSNFSSKKLEELLKSARIPPAVNQVELHPVWQQEQLRSFCKLRGIHVSAWSPLGAPGASYGTREVISHPVVLSVAAQVKRTPAQVILRWSVQNGVSVLPRSFNPSRLQENADIFSWSLSEQDMQELAKIEQRRTRACEFFCNAMSGPYKTLEELWDDDG